jgi:long-chain acyl-CoA synthetase
VFPISEILPRACAMYPHRLAMWDGDVRYTFAELGRRVNALVGALKARGIGRGDRVALLDVNSHRYAEGYYACAQAGMVFVPLNSRLALPELKYILNDSGAKALLLSDPFFPIIEGLGQGNTTLEFAVAYGKGPYPSGAMEYGTFLASAAPDTMIAKINLSDVAQIYYTSGTTGDPKGVCLTYGNMYCSAFDALAGLALTEQDIWLHAAPMFHLVDAWSIWSLPLIGAAQAVVHFTPERFMETVARTRTTATALPSTLISMTAEHPKRGAYDLSSLRFIMYGGSPTPIGVMQRAVKVLPTTYLHGYGITETSGITTLLSPTEFCVEGPPERIALTSSAGRAVPHIKLEIADDHGSRLGAGQLGEIVVGGPRVMAGYWNKPKHTSDALRNGWYYTGDVGYLDEEQRLFVADRKKDMIISGGENVYSVEVENILSVHPAVREVAVIGVPDERWGEAVKAIIVLNDGSAVSAEELIQFCEGRIARYKIPKSIDFSGELLPKTGPGKIAKRKLRDPYWADRKQAI